MWPLFGSMSHIFDGEPRKQLWPMVTTRRVLHWGLLSMLTLALAGGSGVS